MAPICNVPLFHTAMIPITASPRNRGSSDQPPSRLVLFRTEMDIFARKHLAKRTVFTLLLTYSVLQFQAPIARLESLSESLDGAGKTEGGSGANLFDRPDGGDSVGGGGVPRQRSSDV